MLTIRIVGNLGGRMQPVNLPPKEGHRMARTVRNQKIDTPSARAKLAAGRYWVSVAPGCAFGYRKGTKGGIWAAKLVKGTLRRETAIGPADDVLAADGSLALSYGQAQE